MFLIILYSNMTGLEYILLHVQEPILYVIRKQHRHSPTHATPLADYYIIAGIVYQAPDLISVINSRIVSSADLQFLWSFWGTFTELWKVIIVFIMSVCPHGTQLMDYEMLVFFENVNKIQDSLKSDKNIGYFKQRPIYIFIISHSFLRMKNVSDKCYGENQNTYFMLSNYFLKKIVLFMR